MIVLKSSRPHLEVMRDLVSLCLQNQDSSVQLHGAKVTTRFENDSFDNQSNALVK